MGWTNSPYVLAKVMAVFNKFLRGGGARPPTTRQPHAAATRRSRRSTCYVDDLLFLTQGSMQDALDYRTEVEAALQASGLMRSPGKGTWTPDLFLCVTKPSRL